MSPGARSGAGTSVDGRTHNPGAHAPRTLKRRPMSDAVIQVLNQQLDNLQGQYTLRFANQPRITRDLGALDAIIDGAEKILHEAQAAKGTGAVDTLALARERLQFYREVRDNVAEAKKAGEDAHRASELGTLANFVFGKYRRHFASRSRQDRDLGLLGEMVEDLKAIKADMEPLAKRVPDYARENLEIVSRNLEMYVTERGEIVESRGGLNNSDLANLLGGLANAQFEVYSVHFANRARTTRRPELLERIIANLENIVDQMKGMSYINDTTRRNIGIVNDRLALYRDELQKVRTSQRVSNLDELVDSLRYEGNRIIDEYAAHFGGQDRATRDLQLLSNLCDRLGEVEKLMRKLARIYDHDRNNANMWLMRDALSMFEREYRAIEEAKGA